ncbi:MAG: ATP-binding protein [bacterium]|nr:ATP-binding protein [bacterium]
MAKPVLYILCGLPYSGKTTLTRELVKRFGFKVVSMDNVMGEKGYDPVTMTQEDWNEVYSEGYERLKEFLRESSSIILDIGNLKKSERQTARDIAQSLGVDYKLIYINTPLEEIKRRRSENQQTKERGHLEDETMNSALKMWEEPATNENPILYNQEMNLEEWIKENI